MMTCMGNLWTMTTVYHQQQVGNGSPMCRVKVVSQTQLFPNYLGGMFSDSFMQQISSFTLVKRGKHQGKRH